MIRLSEAISSAEGTAVVACPFFELGHGRPEAFLVGEQAGEVGAKLGQEARVAAEVGAAEALMAERAGLAVRLNVGRFGADAEGDGDLADGVTGRLGVQESLDQRAGALGVAVHLQGSEHVDSLALPLAGDAEVRLGGGQAGVAHELGQHLDRRAGVGMTLGEAVAERVRHDTGAVVRLAARAKQLGQLVDPLATARIEGETLAALTPLGFIRLGGEQGERRGGTAGVLRPGPVPAARG